MTYEKDALEPCTLCGVNPALPESYVKLCQECSDRIETQLRDGKFLGLMQAIVASPELSAEFFRHYDPRRLSNGIAWYGIYSFSPVAWPRPGARIVNVTADWTPVADWYCTACAAPQIGPLPPEPLPARCAACGPGDGFVPCPACIPTPHPGCVLCKGARFVEEL